MNNFNEPRSSIEVETKPFSGAQISESEEAVFIPTFGSEEELAHAAYLATLADPSRTGKMLAKAASQKIGPISLPKEFDLVSASPISNLSGVNINHTMIREGTLETVEKWIHKIGGHIQCGVRRVVDQVNARGDFAIVVASEKIVLGVIALKMVRPI
jgi:high-affinity K+ transport system ATPase subunit B